MRLDPGHNFIPWWRVGDVAGADLNVVQNQVSEILRSQYGIPPKRGTITYPKPYPEAYDLLDPPPKFKILDFSKFSEDGNISTIEHISRYLA